MKPIPIRYFLDYGCCFWGTGSPESNIAALDASDLGLSLEAQEQVDNFLKEYDQHYDWGCPPSEGWSIEDCRRFNREHRRILSLVCEVTKGRFLICNEQFDLIEEADLLDEFYRRGREFIEERLRTIYHSYDDLKERRNQRL